MARTIKYYLIALSFLVGCKATVPAAGGVFGNPLCQQPVTPQGSQACFDNSGNSYIQEDFMGNLNLTVPAGKNINLNGSLGPGVADAGLFINYLTAGYIDGGMVFSNGSIATGIVGSTTLTLSAGSISETGATDLNVSIASGKLAISGSNGVQLTPSGLIITSIVSGNCTMGSGTTCTVSDTGVTATSYIGCSNEATAGLTVSAFGGATITAGSQYVVNATVSNSDTWRCLRIN